MYLYITTILVIIFDHINKIVSQGIPISPCPKMFQYRFDGSEWFGMLSVRNPAFEEALHLRVTLSMRGKPTTNYLGEIELLTRGQFSRNIPILYKVKFPKNHFPPNLLQITTNNEIVCLGKPDHSIFVTQIQLEHTRKLTFMPGEIQPPLSPTSSPLLPTNLETDSKHLPSTNMEMNPIHISDDICGTVDDRIRFQVLHALKQKTAFPSTMHPFGKPFEDEGSLLMSTLLQRQNDDISADDNNSPPLVTIDTDSNSEFKIDDAAETDDSVIINELPSIARGAWPWLAAVYVNNLTSLAYQCGGTLISNRIVISSAHCFQLFQKRYTANEVLVFLGRHNLKSWNEENSLAAPVDDIFIHPDYNQYLSSYDADIAVLILKNEVRFNTFIRPACMWSGPTEQQYIEGEHGIIVGWGLGGFNTTKHASATSTVPRIVSTPIVSNDVCFQANSKYRSLSSNRTFCAGTVVQHHMSATKSGFGGKPLSFKPQLHQGPCSGDSGGGLMIFKNNRWMLRGTVSGALPTDDSDAAAASRSTHSCIVNQYVIYTDVAKFLDWIFAFII